MVNHFGFILRAYAGQEFLFCFRDAQFVKGIFDRFRNIIPVLFRLFRRADIIHQVVQVKIGNIRSPIGHRALLKMFKALEPVIQHPFRFALHRGNLADNFLIQPFLGFEDRNIRILKGISLIVQPKIIVIVFYAIIHFLFLISYF